MFTYRGHWRWYVLISGPALKELFFTYRGHWRCDALACWRGSPWEVQPAISFLYRQQPEMYVSSEALGYLTIWFTFGHLNHMSHRPQRSHTSPVDVCIKSWLQAGLLREILFNKPKRHTFSGLYMWKTTPSVDQKVSSLVASVCEHDIRKVCFPL